MVKTKNIQLLTSNTEHPRSGAARFFGLWMVDVGCLIFIVVFSLSASFQLRAQVPQQLPPGALIQLQTPQPPVDVSKPETIAATASFDPPAVRIGDSFFYRATVNAPESDIRWPAEIPAPAELKIGKMFHGQTAKYNDNKYQPLTAFACKITASKPGNFTISNFVVRVGAQSIVIPAANIEVVESNGVTPAPAHRLALEISETNLYLGQPFRVSVLLTADHGNQIQALHDIQFNGNGFMTDKTAVRQSIASVNHNGQTQTTFIYETVATPIATGPLELSAQGFTAPPFSTGPITITSVGGPINLSGAASELTFLFSDVVQLNIRPLPLQNSLPGFTGAIGKFIADKPQLATNRLRVGEPMHLKFGFRGEGNLTRFVPPQAPRSREWQIIEDNPPGNGFTLIPVTDEATNTPAIPFCAFDPSTKRFYDLTIPALAVTIAGEGLPTQMPASEKTSAAPKLSSLAASRGTTAAGLKPLQKQGWFVMVQLLPVFGLIALWRWDEQRRFMEAHPEIVRRRRAKRELRREKIKLQQAIAAHDAERFVRHAAAAMRIAVAPHFPADARALVGGDVLTQLVETEGNGRAGETVRDIFAAADAQFAARMETHADLLALQSSVQAVLKQLEEKL